MHKSDKSIYSKEVHSDQVFYANDGSEIKSIKGLKEALQSMDDKTYTHHVNEHKNDFGHWIKIVFSQDILAKDIFEAANKAEIIKIIEDTFSKSHALHSALKTLQTQADKEINNKKEENKSTDSNNKKESEENQHVEQTSKSAEEKENKESGPIITTNDSTIMVDLLIKEKEILEKQKVIEFREKKIEEIEERIEKKLSSGTIKVHNDKDDVLFSKSFIQGILVGILLTVLVLVMYWEFFV